ncbi:MAG TPA: hypothetical protein VJ487_03130 [Alphaproteobacteria bacterium]|nr:hypothetical protein [Alphaproteobacteria bacterium]
MIGVVCLITAAVPALAEQVFLVVAASNKDPALIADIGRKLAPVAPHGLAIETGDCGEQRHLLAFAAEISSSSQDARAALDRIKATIKDAYIKKCDVKPGSLLSLRISAVDPSIAAVPRNAVNWSDSDRISAVLPLSQDASLVIVRHFVEAPDDPLEGRRERILLARSSGERVVLSDNCYNLGDPSTADGLIAFDCAREEAGDQLLHSVEVVTEGGQHLKEIEHCRKPKWIDKMELACQMEAVRSDGTLVLTPHRVHIELGGMLKR